MKQAVVLIILLLGALPLSSIAQIGVADPVTGNAAIDFYGKVGDQNSDPVSGAKVSLKVLVGYQQSPIALGTRYETSILHTDAKGNFALIGSSGHSVEIVSIVKDGYKLSDKATRIYGYSWAADIFHPDSNRPVIFKMWKRNGIEPLVGSVWKGNISCDGTTNRFDLSRGHRSLDGGLEISCTRNPLQSPPPGNGPFDYIFYIAVVGGGIQPTGDEFTYLAPENGYTLNFMETKKSGEPGWRGKLKQEFYIKTADGRYGRLSINWYAAQNSPTHLDWNCSINPSGSRNLER